MSEFFRTPEKIFKRLVDHHHAPVEASADALAAASRSRRAWIPVAGTDGRFEVSCFDDRHWRIRIRMRPGQS